jgi:hypothetical protein
MTATALPGGSYTGLSDMHSTPDAFQETHMTGGTDKKVLLNKERTLSDDADLPQIDTTGTKLITNTPDQYIDMYDPAAAAEHPDAVLSAADDFYDLEHGSSVNGFGRKDFQELVFMTYTEYYGSFKDQFNPHEYLDCIDGEKLVERYGDYLCISGDNMLTRASMPWLDLGETPVTHSFMRGESDQTFYSPVNNNPSLVYVHYASLQPKYDDSDAQLLFQ